MTGQSKKSGSDLQRTALTSVEEFERSLTLKREAEAARSRALIEVTKARISLAKDATELSQILNLFHYDVIDSW